MIYEPVNDDEPLRQGDIFVGLPMLDLPADELSIIHDDGRIESTPWEELRPAEGDTALVAVRLTTAVVGSQDCDTARAPDITLYEARPFGEVEGKIGGTPPTSAKKWVSVIVTHSRINQKWFYLPPDLDFGIEVRMGVDFNTAIRLPRLALEQLLSRRVGRLNHVADEHFRERLAEYYRRYPYDEWYPLNREEFEAYKGNAPDAEPFPWQREPSE